MTARATLSLLLILAFVAAQAHAAATQNDLVVAARALSFIQSPPKGDVAIGIVYLPSNPESAAEAQNLQKLIGAGLKVGNLTLKPVLVHLDEAQSANVGLFFLTTGLGLSAGRLTAAIKAKRIPCVTVDIPQVLSGLCSIGVRSQPKVEILVNRAAALESGVAFVAVFRMMVTEI
jgi:hypothetical protein